MTKFTPFPSCLLSLVLLVPSVLASHSADSPPAKHRPNEFAERALFGYSASADDCLFGSPTPLFGAPEPPTKDISSTVPAGIKDSSSSEDVGPAFFLPTAKAFVN